MGMKLEQRLKFIRNHSPEIVYPDLEILIAEDLQGEFKNEIERFKAWIGTLRTEMMDFISVYLPEVRVRDDKSLRDRWFRIRAHGKEVFCHNIQSDESVVESIFKALYVYVFHNLEPVEIE
jgi:flagellar biosynthesis component FlhA